MADQQNNKPEEQRRLENQQQQLRRERPGAAPGWRGLWIWPVVIVLILILWFGFWGWGAHGGWFWSRQHEGANNVAPAPENRMPATPNGEPRAVTKDKGQNGAAALKSDHKEQYVGQTFQIVRTPVLKKVSDNVFWVGEKNDPAPLLVVVSNTAKTSPNLEPGEMVDVVGQVVKAPAAQQSKRDWHLSTDGAQRLEHEGAYVQASQAILAQPTPAT